jgi:peptide/nickel transport system permease protein
MRRRTVVGFLVAAHLAVLAAGFLAPYHYADQHRDYPYAPPMRPHWSGGGLFAYGLAAETDGTYREDPIHAFPVRWFTGGRLFSVEEPGVLFLLGSDGYGRDVFSRVLYGAQVSLMTGLLAATLSLGIGWILGTVAGFYGGRTDQIVMRFSELFMTLPWLYFLLAIRAFLPLKITSFEAFLLIICIIGGVGWVRPARLVRSVVLSARERGYVLAARGFGAGPFYLIRRHILPHTWSVVLTQATVLIPQYILAEVTLSFVGLGGGEPAPSWGNMLSEARQYHALVHHPWLLAPGFAAIPILIGYLFLADTVLDKDRPKSKR